MRERRSSVRGAASATVVALLAALLLTAPGLSPRAGAQDDVRVAKQARTTPTRVLLVGDSITQASVGDYSWRYFAWKHLRRVGADVDFVGPSSAPRVEPGRRWAAVYNDQAFDRDHAGLWGANLAPVAGAPAHDRVALLGTYRPDVLVLQLGTNDLVWSKWDPGALAPFAREWVLEARRAAAGTDVVLVQVPESTLGTVARYNRLLDEVAADLDTPDERVVVARAAQGYVTGTGYGQKGDTYDRLHPNTRGQVRIAAAVSDALARIGIGAPYERPLSFPAEGPRVRPTVTATPGDDWSLVEWSRPAGATSADVWARRAGGRWRLVVRAHPTTSIGVSRMAPCVRHDVKVRARKGWTLAGKDMTSRIVTTVAGPSLMLTRAPRPRPGAVARGVRVRWSSVADACRYRVQARFRTPEGRRVLRAKTVRGTSVRFVGARPGTRVRVRVRAVGARDRSTWSGWRGVRARRR